MSLDLSSYSSIQTALFCKVVVPDYATLTFSNYSRNLTIDGTNYTGIGQLLDISDSTSELRASRNELTVTISGIPAQNISDLLTYRFKGSSITVTRAIFDPATGQLLSITGNPAGRFQGIINNFGLNETWDGQNASNTISFVCTSTVGLLMNKIAGRKTNSRDQKTFYPTDLSMDRVTQLANSNYNFGAVVK